MYEDTPSPVSGKLTQTFGRRNKRYFEVRDLFKRIDSTHCVVYIELG